MVQRETHPANRPPAPFDPLQPEVQLRGRKMKKEKREIKRKREREKKYRIKRKRGQKRERGREKAEEKSVNPGYRARLPRRLGSTSHWHSNFRPDRNLFPSGPFFFFFFFFPSLFFYSSPRWRPSPPTKPPANPLWCTANIRRLSLVSPPQFVFSLATPFDQYFNFAMLRYLAGPKRTGRADARERSVVLPRGGITM